MSHTKVRNYCQMIPLHLHGPSPIWIVIWLAWRIIRENWCCWIFSIKLATHALQSLHEKYGDRGFKLIGIDPIDSLEEGIAEFLEKRGVSYTVVLGGKDLAKTYRVSGYPTVYLIDQKGKIIFSQVGYGDDAKEKLEKVILNHLK